MPVLDPNAAKVLVFNLSDPDRRAGAINIIRRRPVALRAT